MIALALSSLFVGMALALHFSVFVLVPMTPFTWAVVAVVGMRIGETVPCIASLMVVVTITLQLGYLGGLFMWSALREHGWISSRPAHLRAGNSERARER